MLLVLLIASVPYYFWLHQSSNMGVSDFLSLVYSQSATTALWYLYSYIALLLTMPFLRRMVKNMQQMDFIYLIIVHVIFVGVLPCLEYFVWHGDITLHKSLSPIFFTSQNIFFALLGYYLEHVFDINKCNIKKLTIGAILSVVAISVTCIITYYGMTVAVESNKSVLEMFFNCYICVPSITVYCIVKKISTKIKSRRTVKVITILGSGVFGVYLIEKIMRSITSNICVILTPVFGVFISTLLWCLLTLCLGLLVILPLKYMPKVKDIVNKFI
jgi:surface polysaccharide O-acyltransferase-like enzyme